MIYAFFILIFITLIYCVYFISKALRQLKELEYTLYNMEYKVDTNVENIESLAWSLVELTVEDEGKEVEEVK